MKRKISDVKLVKYYKIFWALTRLHSDIDLRFGETPRTSEKFTEFLCMKIFDLEKSGCRQYDLKTKGNRGKRIEVKGTTSKGGKTTIRYPLPFDYLYWVYMTEEIITIYKITKSAFDEYKNNGGRISVFLGSKKLKKDECYKFKVEGDSFVYFNETTTDK